MWGGSGSNRLNRQCQQEIFFFLKNYNKKHKEEKRREEKGYTSKSLTPFHLQKKSKNKQWKERETR